MIFEIVAHINKSFAYVENVFNICEVLEKQNKDGSTNSFPAFNHRDVSIIPNSIYHRITGEVPIEETDDVRDDYRLLTYPMRLVAFLPKDLVSDCFHPAKIANRLMKDLLEVERVKFSREQKISILKILPTSQSLDPRISFEAETANVAFKIQDNQVFIYINYTISFEGSLNCFVEC